MNFRINKKCIGCGMCENICPEKFSIINDVNAQADQDEVEYSNIINRSAIKAKSMCPVNAIEFYN